MFINHIEFSSIFRAFDGRFDVSVKGLYKGPYPKILYGGISAQFFRLLHEPAWYRWDTFLSVLY